MSNTQKPRGVREALKNRKVKKSYYDIPQVEHEVVERLAEELVLAKNTVRAGEYLGSREPTNKEVAEATAKAKREVAAAQKKVDACYYRVWFVGMPEKEFDALVNAHPSTDEQRQRAKEKGEEQPVWNEETFPYALLERCAQESDLTAADWEEEVTGWAAAEKAEIIRRVLDCNLRSFSSDLVFD